MTCLAVVLKGERAAWVETTDTGRLQWTATGHVRLLVRAPDVVTAQRATEELLRSGAFAVVVLAGAQDTGSHTIRLAGAAHDGSAAAVALTERATAALIRITSRLMPAAYELRSNVHAEPAAMVRAAVRVHVRAPGWDKSATVHVDISQHDLRIALDPGLADRRGIAR
jgi:hypothetical protein